MEDMVASALDYFEDQKYGDACCALDDLMEDATKTLELLEKLEDEGT